MAAPLFTDKDFNGIEYGAIGADEPSARQSTVLKLMEGLDQVTGGDLEDLYEKDIEHDEAIADLEQSDLELQAWIEANSVDISDLQAKDLEHDSQIAAIVEVNNNHQTDIENLQNSDADTDADLAALDGRIVKLEGGYQTVVPWIPGTMEPALNTNYAVTLNGPYSFGTFPVAEDGDWISFLMDVQTSSPIDFTGGGSNSVYRVGTDGELAGPVVFPVGTHLANLRKTGPVWILEDSAASGGGLTQPEADALYVQKNSDAALHSLYVEQNAGVDGDFNVDGKTTLHDNVDIQGNVTIADGDLTAYGNIIGPTISALQSTDAKLSGGWQQLTAFAGSPVPVNKNYIINTAGGGTYIVPPFAAGADGDWIMLLIKVDSGDPSRSFNFHANNTVYKVGTDTQLATVIPIPPGRHLVRFRSVAGVWWMEEPMIVQQITGLQSTDARLMGGWQLHTPFVLGTTALAINTNYTGVLNSNWTLGALPMAQTGDWISLILQVINNGTVIDFNVAANAVFRTGNSPAQRINAIPFLAGWHHITLRMGSSVWHLEDSSGDVSRIGGQILTSLNAPHTISLTDAGKYIRMYAAALTTIVVPTDASVKIPIGTEIIFRRTSGALEVSNAGVTVNGSELFAAVPVHGCIGLKKIAPNEWDVI